MESASVLLVKCAKALNGTALLSVVAVVVFAELLVEVEVDGAFNTFVGGLRMPEDGV